ncbi:MULTISPECIES: cytochrome c-type biogenesis protein [Oceanisphaera]|uniref:Cytochrome c-type biogenesis protein n=1 Tax=Oceanisphaera ostreae TaxID=914151 RepID=A0ABW3KFP7_9GAMM
MGFRLVLVLLAGLCLPLFGLTTAMAATSVYDFSSPEQEQTFRELTRELRCPKCQNQDIGDSDAELAKDLRDKSYELLQKGNSKQDVIDYMVARYGNFILYKPPFMASTMILWFGPVIVMLVGLLIVVVRTRKKPRNTAADNALSAEQEARLSELLNKDKEN